jgi:hypothetical protein
VSLRRRHWIPLLLTAIAFSATAWAALTPASSDSREQVYVIPKGTWAGRTAGKDIEAFPSTIHLTIGIKDVLVLKNHDDVPQMFGPVLIMPGQSFRLPFRLASSYQFACTAHVSGQLTVVVEPIPEPGWRLLRWRVNTIVKRGEWL